MPDTEFYSIIEKLPELSPSELKKLKVTLSTFYKSETENDDESASDDLINFRDFYQVCCNYALNFAGISLPSKVPFKKYLKEWMKVEQFIQSIGMTSPRERNVLFRFLAATYINWLVEQPFPMVAHAVCSHLEVAPLTLREQLPMINTPLVKAVMMNAEGAEWKILKSS